MAARREPPYYVLNKTHETALKGGLGPNGGRRQSHHSIQKEWANQNLKGYDEDLAPTITLETGKERYAHTVISTEQTRRKLQRKANGKGLWSSTIDEELTFLVDDFRKAGFEDDVIRQVLEANYEMLDRLGIKYTRPKGF